MAVKTRCQTQGAIFATEISNRGIKVDVRFSADGKEIYLSDKEAELLEANIHNVLELVLSRYYM